MMNQIHDSITECEIVYNCLKTRMTIFSVQKKDSEHQKHDEALTPPP